MYDKFTITEFTSIHLNGSNSLYYMHCVAIYIYCHTMHSHSNSVTELMLFAWMPFFLQMCYSHPAFCSCAVRWKILSHLQLRGRDVDFYLFIAWQDTNKKVNCRDSCKAHKASSEEPRVVYADSSPGARAWFSVGNKAVMSSLISTVESVWWSQRSALWINIRMSSIINNFLSKAVHDPNPMFVRKAQLAFWNKCEVFDVSLGFNIFFIPPSSDLVLAFMMRWWPSGNHWSGEKNVCSPASWQPTWN